MRTFSTPTGLAAAVTHFAGYSELVIAYNELVNWIHVTEHQSTGISWELYGDWEDDPARRRTDVFVSLAK